MYKYLALVFALIPLQSTYAGMDAANQALHSGDYARAAEEFRQLAEQGDSRAQSQLGYLYYAGEGVQQNYAEAVKWYEKAAIQGDKDAQYNLAVAYAFGDGVQQDFKQAAIWYRRAGDQGHPVAQYSLGISYAYGEGVPQDPNLAAEWFLKSANAGYVKAQVMVGSLYHTGDGLPKDYTKAAAWYRKAADQGDAAAQYNLGSLYRAGKGVDKNVDEAIKLFHLSADQGYEAAQKELSTMERAIAGATHGAKPVAPAEAAAPPATSPVTTPPAAPTVAVISTPPPAVPQEKVETAPETQTPKPVATAEPAPQSVQYAPKETVTAAAPPAPPSAVPAEKEASTASMKAQTSAPGEEPKRSGFLSGLKKFFTRAPAPETAVTSAAVTETPVTQVATVTTPTIPQETVTPLPVTQPAAATETTPAIPHGEKDSITAPALVITPEPPPAPVPAAAHSTPSIQSMTADFHKIMGDKRAQKDSTENSETVTARAESPTPVTQHLTDHPEPVPASTAKTKPEASPPVAETPAEHKITAKAEPVATPPVSQTTETPVASAPTDKPGGLRGFFGKLFKSKKDEPAETPSPSRTADKITATATPSAGTPASEPVQAQDQSTARETREGQTTPASESKPVVMAKAESSESPKTPVAETAEKKLQTSPLDTLTAQAVEGNVESQYQLAKLYYLGDQVKQDYSQAFLWYRRAAQQGHAEAQYNLGTMYLMGEGIEQSDKEAKNWYEKAAAQGHEAARHNLENPQRVPAPQEKPVETTKVAAAETEEPKKKGGVLAYLGGLFKSGKKEADVDTSAKQQAAPSAGAPPTAAAGSTPATNKQPAATPGLSDYEKGLAYSEGKGVPQNDNSAFILFQSAAQQNYAPAQYQLGNAYMGGYGTDKNPDTAITWYDKSARQGYALAQRTLASIYMNGGNGVKQNKPLALAWYSILSGGGNVLDIHRRDTLKGELSGPEVQESEKLKQELSAGLPSP